MVWHHNCAPLMEEGLGLDLSTHSEVHEAQELLQHFCHDGEISFRQVVSHSSHIQLGGGSFK